MESYERGQPATDLEHDLGEAGASAAGAYTGAAGIDSGMFGVGAAGSGQEAATDVESDLGRPGDAYSAEPPATDPTLR